jgi:hypothetical protein
MNLGFHKIRRITWFAVELFHMELFGRCGGLVVTGYSSVCEELLHIQRSKTSEHTFLFSSEKDNFVLSLWPVTDYPGLFPTSLSGLRQSPDEIHG